MSLMKIRMAVQTAGKLQSLKRFAGGVAFFALQKCMTTLEWETGKIVIETRLIDSFPTGGIVAFCAIPAKAVLMRIPMAVHTLCKLNSGKLHVCIIIGVAVINDAGMAFFASNLSVFSGQAETGLVVIKLLGRLPAIHQMAGCAIGTQLPPVFITMTTQTIGIQSQKSALQILLFFSKQTLILNMRRLVAGAAVQLGVFPLQLKPGFFVIEIFLTSFPIDEIKIPAVVLHMTVFAAAKFGIGMEPLIIFDALPQNSMTA